MLYQEKDSHSPAVEAPTNIQQDNEYVSEKILSFLTESAYVLLRVVKQRKRQIVSKLVALLTDKPLQINVFERYIKVLTGCKRISSRRTGEIIKDDSFIEC